MSFDKENIRYQRIKTFLTKPKFNGFTKNELFIMAFIKKGWGQDIAALSNMAVEKRPLHCTDLKREVLYIKDNDEWKRDEDKGQIKSAVTKVVDKNLSNTEEWLDKHPNVLTPGSKDSNRYIKMSENSLGTGDESEQNKIIKNILKEVVIDKEK